MKAAALMFYKDSQDLIPEVSKSINACEYLIRYMDNPGKFSNKSSYIFIISGNHWRAGYNLGQIREPKWVKEKLAWKARSVGLYGSTQTEPPISTEQAFH